MQIKQKEQVMKKQKYMIKNKKIQTIYIHQQNKTQKEKHGKRGWGRKEIIKKNILNGK